MTDSLVQQRINGVGNAYLVPLEDASRCLEEISLSKDFGLSTLQSYRDIFELGYAYYYYGNDVLKSSPIVNPYGWTIHNGSSGGQVNYEEEFNRLIDELEKNGNATGMLAYEINDVILRARDAHSSTVEVPGVIALVDQNFDVEGDGWSGRLSLAMDDAGNVRVVNIGSSNSTKTVSSINGEDPLLFLREITSNTGLGRATQFKSAGVRLNVFLDGFASSRTRNGVVWLNKLAGAGDFRKLPKVVDLVYDDGSTDQWRFNIGIPEGFIGVPTNTIQAIISESVYPAYTKYEEVQQKIGDLSQKSAQMGVAKEARNFPNPLGFKVYIEEGAPVPYSAYTIYGDMMVWKIPTFQSPSPGSDEQVNFWNDMVDDAVRNNITHLLVDISDNAGGLIDNAWRNLFLMYQGAEVEDVVQKFVVRLSDAMVAQWAAWDQSQDIWNASLSNDSGLSKKIAMALENDLDTFNTAVVDLLLLNKFSESLGSQRSNGFWFFVSAEAEYNLQSSVLKFLKNEGSTSENILKLLDAVKDLTSPPAFCQFNEIDCYEEMDRWTMEVNQGGTIVNTTIPLFAGQFIDEEHLELNRPSMVNISGARASPFESYTLLSNSQVVGSAANMFHSGIRDFANANANGTYPKTTTVSMGCYGASDECEMSQFQVSIDDGKGLLARMNDDFIPLFALSQILDILPSDLLEEAGITDADVKEYSDRVSRYASLLPKPPALGEGFPRFASSAILPPEIDGVTVPQEFFVRPADAYLPIWPEPQGMSLQKQTNLAQVYGEVNSMLG